MNWEMNPQNLVVEGKKQEENHGKKVEETHKWVWGPFLKKKSVCNSLVLKRTEETNCSGYMNCWVVFSNQVDKQGCREIE
jgi:hypothetical protein